ncbi:MAG: glycosyltransferase family 9 protein, partial [Phycisphaerae bacterium]
MRPVQHSSEADPRSILVVLPTWVGDFVMATPTLRALRDRFADAHITFLMEPNLRELVAGGDWMNESIEWPLRGGRDASAGASRVAMSPRHKPYRDLVWDLRRRRFDWAVLLPNSFRAALLARLIAAGRRIGYDRDGRGMLLTDRLPVTNRRHQRRGADRRTSRPTDRDRTVSTKDGGSS